MIESEFANVDGDEVLWEAAERYVDAFTEDKEYDNPSAAREALRAIFIDGARWAIKNRIKLLK